MKTSMLISIAAFTVACDGSPHARTDSSKRMADDAKPVAASGSRTSTSTVTLVGCLQGPGLSGAAGTADAPGHAAGQTGPFVLANAAVEPGSVGPNGAGVSGGTAVSAGTSFELDSVPADAQASLNKRVRVTGRLHPRAATTSGDAAGTRDTSGTVTAAPSTTAESSTRDDVRANSLGVAGDSTSHRLTVETLQVVAPQCGPQQVP